MSQRSGFTLVLQFWFNSGHLVDNIIGKKVIFLVVKWWWSWWWDCHSSPLFTVSSRPISLSARSVSAFSCFFYPIAGERHLTGHECLLIKMESDHQPTSLPLPDLLRDWQLCGWRSSNDTGWHTDPSICPTSQFLPGLNFWLLSRTVSRCSGEIDLLVGNERHWADFFSWNKRD